MLPFYSSSTAQISFQADRLWRSPPISVSSGVPRLSRFDFKRTRSELLGKQAANSTIQWSFLGGSRVCVQPKIQRFLAYRKHLCPSASWLSCSQIANSAFTLGTIAVLPFYTLMFVAPNAELTKRSMESSIPYVLLGTLYGYLLYLSWTPDTIRLMFASKYWLPELPGIARMFSNEMTMASAWIHLLVVDLFAARQIFFDGLKNGIETRHSVSFCLLFCPLGIIVHSLTKILTKRINHTK